MRDQAEYWAFRLLDSITDLREGDLFLLILSIVLTVVLVLAQKVETVVIKRVIVIDPVLTQFAVDQVPLDLFVNLFKGVDLLAQVVHRLVGLRLFRLFGLLFVSCIPLWLLLG